jgi:exonuclease SbcC
MSKTISLIQFKNCLGITDLNCKVGKVNVISGENGQGKTSILEIIEKAFTNNSRRPDFVKKGADKASIFIQLEDGTEIKRVITEKTNRADVTKDGMKASKVETFLKSLVSGLAFNPVDFLSKSEKEQSDILFSIIPMKITEDQIKEWFNDDVKFDLSEHGLKVLKRIENYYYEKRREANSDVKAFSSDYDSTISQLPMKYDAEQWRNISLTELARQLDKVRETNGYIKQANDLINDFENTKQIINNKYDLKIKEINKILEDNIENAKESVKQQKSQIENSIQDLYEEIEKYKKLIDKCNNEINIKKQELKVIDENVIAIKIEVFENESITATNSTEKDRNIELDKASERIKKAKEYIENNKIVDIEALKTNIEHVENMKSFVSLYDNAIKTKESLKHYQELSLKYDKLLEIARKLPAKLIEKSEMPVENLSIDENMKIMINGLPISNLSTAEQIRVALNIARATAGDLKLVCVDKFESLSANMQEEFLKEASKDDFQYFISKVDEGDMKIMTEVNGVKVDTLTGEIEQNKVVE